MARTGRPINEELKKERLGKKKYNNAGEIMEVIEYKNTDHIKVKFIDGSVVPTTWNAFNKGTILNPNYYNDRLGFENHNFQGCLMKVVEYNGTRNVIVEFQDEHKYRKKVQWVDVLRGDIKNPYCPFVCGVGMIGVKYPSKVNGNITIEYQMWRSMLARAYNNKIKEKQSAYKDVTCCNEWLLFENFYEWLHSQENFEHLLNKNMRIELEKDILVKGNKTYSPSTCCVVPKYVNTLFTKRDNNRGNEPIGVFKNKNGYSAKIIYGKHENKSKSTRYYYPSSEEAFYAYKKSKEDYIKRIAQEEYEKKNISKACYDAMMNYQVEITD